ncbi:MAG: hypothetical protein WB508_02480 [Aeromicrobium sp.]|uniref:hypothetical protein n=1 Tax=Aeromicrobium sp. TaxID=1871063 RepID=UPI003C4F5C09
MRWTVVAVMLCVLAGCSGSTDPEPASSAPATSKSPKPKPTPKPSAAAPTGEPAPEALSAFRCEPTKKSTWVAAGLLANDSKKAVTYQVSVYVGPLDSTSREVRTVQVANVEAGGSVRFKLTKVPADGEECHVQVIRIKVG